MRFSRRLRVGVLVLMATAIRTASADDSATLKVREFVVMGYPGIVQDLAAGKGPYLTSLLELLAVSPQKTPETLDQLKSFVPRYPNIMDFADAVAATRTPSPAAAAAPTTSLPPLPSDRPLYSGAELENALKHLNRGMKVTVYLQNGTTLQGRVVEYDAGRLMLRTAGGTSKICRFPEIRALDAPSN